MIHPLNNDLPSLRDELDGQKKLNQIMADELKSLREKGDDQKKLNQIMVDELKSLREELDEQKRTNEKERPGAKDGLTILQEKQTEPNKSISTVENLSKSDTKVNRIKQQDKFSRIKAINGKFLTTTSFYGVSRFAKAQILSIKAAWVIATLTCLSAGIYVIWSNITDYQMYDVITKSLRKNVKSEDGIDYPSLTFCAPIGSTKIKFSRVKVERYVPRFMTSSITVNMFTTTFDVPANCIIFNNYNSSTFFQKAENENDHYVFEFDFSNNIFEGLNVFIRDNYVNTLNYFSANNLIQIPIDKNGTYIVQLTKYVEKRLENPYNNCTKNDMTYRYLNCLEQCLNEELIKNGFNCTMDGYYSSSDLERCELTPSFKRQEHQFDEECKKHCPMECDMNRFESEVTRRKNPNGLEIRIKYNDMSYMELTQSPKITQASLVSSIGGSLGLFIGIRFLSIVELIEYLIEVSLVLFR